MYRRTKFFIYWTVFDRCESSNIKRKRKLKISIRGKKKNEEIFCRVLERRYIYDSSGK